MPAIPTDAAAQAAYWAKVDKQPDGCWRWTSTRQSRQGQFSFRRNGQKYYARAHVYSWWLTGRTVPDDRVLRQTCGDPLCVRPDHLYLATHAELHLAPLEERAERFWARVQRGDPDVCWPWTGPTTEGGYGRTTWEGVGRGAHVVAFELANDTAVPRGRDTNVRHHCDNPPCCNPAHLALGTAAENTGDQIKRGRRFVMPGGHRHPKAKLTAAQVAEMRRRYTEGGGGRHGGISYPQLAREYGLHPQNVGRIIRGEGYRDA